MTEEKNNNNSTIDAIKKNNMIFLSVQEDRPYFHWQVLLYLYQFAKYGKDISDRCYALIAYRDKPSAFATNLAKKNPNVKLYKNESKYTDYVPILRPHVLAKFFKDYPKLGKNVFYHDSDIFLVKMPRFELMLNDNINYLSDTISYISYAYIKQCSNKYKAEHKDLPDLDIFYGMCKAVDIDPQLVIDNQQNSGGAQYLLKNVDSAFWSDCEKQCQSLYTYLNNYVKKYPINHHIQKWTTDMWTLLWVLWKSGKKTVLHKELDFSWATGTVKDYNSKNIFHLAGITVQNCSDKFFKSKFNQELVFETYLKNPKVFMHINQNSATFEYVKVIKEYMNDVYLPEKGMNISVLECSKDIDSKMVTKFKLHSTKPYDNMYIKDKLKQCCGKNVWRSDDKKFIMFWNGLSWILTYAIYEKEIGPKCGGLIKNSSEYPFLNGWNDETIKVEI